LLHDDYNNDNDDGDDDNNQHNHYLFTCQLKNPKANYKISTSKEMKNTQKTKYRKNTIYNNNNNNIQIIIIIMEKLEINIHTFEINIIIILLIFCNSIFTFLINKFKFIFRPACYRVGV
jgi:hypothetical protein